MMFHKMDIKVKTANVAKITVKKVVGAIKTPLLSNCPIGNLTSRHLWSISQMAPPKAFHH